MISIALEADARSANGLASGHLPKGRALPIATTQLSDEQVEPQNDDRHQEDVNPQAKLSPTLPLRQLVRLSKDLERLNSALQAFKTRVQLPPRLRFSP